MNKFKEGYKFRVCSREELIKRGWILHTNHYKHHDWPTECITFTMIKNYEGKILTVGSNVWSEWYTVEENYCIWPAGTFDTVNSII